MKKFWLKAFLLATFYVVKGLGTQPHRFKTLNFYQFLTGINSSIV